MLATILDHGTGVLSYTDDAIVFGKNAEYLSNLKTVLQKIKNAGLQMFDLALAVIV